LNFTEATSDPFQTNPRSGNTDGPLDDAPDGSDLNPRSDAAFGVEFGQFFMTEGFDDCDKTVLELYVSSLTVDLPFNLGSYSIHLDRNNYVNVPDARDSHLFPTDVASKLADPLNLDGKPSLVAALWKVERATNGPILQFNIPDNVGNPGSLDVQNSNVKFTIQLMDEDDWGCNGDPDTIDVNPVAGKTALERSMSLLDDPAGQFTPDSNLRHGEAYQAWKGVLDPIAGDRTGTESSAFDPDRDASLEIRLGDTVPSFFLGNLKTKGLLPASGNCFGSSSTPPCHLT
jgi:hypothetical protein